MGIMLILKGATYTPSESTNPGAGGNNTGGNTPGGSTGGSTTQWQTLAPNMYKEFRTGTLVKISRGALEDKDSVNRLVVFWQLPEGCTSVKVHLPLLYPNFSFEFNELRALPTNDNIAQNSYYSDLVINYHPEDADPSEWYDPTPSLTDCVFTPTQETVGLGINLCLRSAHGAISGEHIAEILNIVDQIIDVH